MQGGDISNEVTPRLLMVFEGLIGLLPTPRSRTVESLCRKARQWGMAVNAYEINEGMAKAINDAVWRRHQQIDVVTFLGEGFADAVAARLEEEQFPIGHVMATTSEKLARRIATMPDVFAVYDPDPTHRFRYGGKGRFLSPHEINSLGV